MLLSHGLRPSLRGTLVVVATVAVAVVMMMTIMITMMAAAVTVTREVMTACDNDEEGVGVNESASLAVLIKSLVEGGGARSALSAVANAPVSPVSPDSPGLAIMVVNGDTDAGKVEPSGIDMDGWEERCQSWALHLPWPRAPLESGLLAGLKSHCCNTRGVGAQGIWQGRE